MAAAKGYQYFILFKLLGFFKTSTLPKKNKYTDLHYLLYMNNLQ